MLQKLIDKYKKYMCRFNTSIKKDFTFLYCAS